VRAGGATRIEKRRPESGSLVLTRTIRGRWGVPLVSYDGRTEGVSHDGTHLVLGNVGGVRPRTVSRFLVLSARTLAVERRITLRGDFSFDALSPTLRTLYLIQLRADEGGLHYVVRALDLRSGRLRPHPVRDPRSHEWLMQGLPITRATSGNGTWAYTLYAGGPHAFVHALDTVHGVAHCIGVPWTGKQDALWRMRMSLRDGDRTLALHWRNGKQYVAIAQGTWRISYPARAAAEGGGFPWWTVGVGGAAALLAAAALAGGIRRRRLTRHDLPAGAAAS
jgi:hypothetical protein